MAEFYTTGTNRIVYRSVGFATALTVTAYIWSPTLVKSALQTFTEVELGLYYLDYDFASLGTYMGTFYEGGVAKASGVFRVTEIAGAASVADAVWDETIADHAIVGSTGEALADATEITLEED